MTPRAILAAPLLLSLAGPFAAYGEQVELRFGEHLGGGDLELRGRRVSRRVDFYLEPGTKPLPGSTLRLVFEHSPALDEERSFLAVSLNHGPLRSVRLDHRSGTVVELTLALPEGMLQASNQLVFSVQQTAPNEKAAWTRILARSSLSLLYERTPVTWTLSDLPAPLLYRHTYGPRRLTVLLPRQPSAQTVEALALAVADLGRRVAPEAIDLAYVRSLVQADSPVLAVGTPKEQPELLGLRLNSEARVLVERGGAVTQDGHRLDDARGVVALPAVSGRHPILVLTGNTASAVGRAARNLRMASRPGSGLIQLVAEDPRSSTPPLREWKGFIPPRTRFTLGDIGDPDAEMAVMGDSPARVRIRATPDARFLGNGHWLKLAFQVLPAFAEDPDAALEIYWNDSLLRQVTLKPLVRGPELSLSLRVPSDALRLDNVLTVAWNGRSGATGPFVMLDPQSEVSLPRDFRAEIPDLALLRSSLYPFSLRPDLGDTVVGLAAGAGDDGLAAVCELAALFGRWLPTDQVAFRVVPEADLGPLRGGANLVLLETPSSPALNALPLPDVRRLRGGEALKRLPFLETRPSPWSSERHVLRLRAPSPALLRAAARSLSQRAFLDRFSGDTAFLAAEGPQCFQLSPQRTVAKVSYLTHVEAWLRDNWIGLPAILALVSGLLFMGLRLALEPRREARVGSASSA